MLDISIENTHCEISKGSNHSYDILEEYTPFISALNQSKRYVEKFGNVKSIFSAAILFSAPISHVLPASDKVHVHHLT